MRRCRPEGLIPLFRLRPVPPCERLVLQHDVTARVEAEDEVLHLTFPYALTGLPNPGERLRAALSDPLERAPGGSPGRADATGPTAPLLAQYRERSGRQ